jgi:GntR family transcriptional regulator
MRSVIANQTLDASRGEIDPGRGAPLYKQVYEALRAGIERGQWRKNAPLPTEGELGRRFAVSRITVRHALQLLEIEGYIRKQKARNAVVLGRDSAAARGWRIDSVEDIIAAAGDAKLRVLSYRREAAPEAAQIFGVAPDTRLDCLRSLLVRDGRAFARSTIYFHPSIGGRLKRGDFDDVIVFRVMQRELNVRLADVKQTIRADLATAEDISRLGCKRGEPILATQLVYRSDRDVTVEIAYTRYPARSASLTYSLDVRGRRA